MPNNATQLYHKNPDLQIVLDFLGRCAPHAQQMAAYYQDAHELEAVKAACAESNIYPANAVPAREPGGVNPGNGNAQHGLTLDREDWLALAGNAMTLLAQALRIRLPAINAALKLVPVRWDALAIPDSALAAWGTSANMIALPGRTVFDYFGSRYPSSARQRGKYTVVRDVEHAAAYKENHAPGFLLDKGGIQNFACNADDWQSEVTSARDLLNAHLSLMLKIGLQMLEAGASGHLKEMHAVLALAGEAPSLVRLQTWLETYEDHVASYGAGQNRFRTKLLQHCLGEFNQWHAKCGLADREAPGVAYSGTPVGNTRAWKWTDSGAAAVVAPAPGPPLATTSTTSTTSTTPTADPVIADGVIIPNGVTVARGAHVRVCAINPETRLKPGTVLHGDVSIASHTRFDGPVTIMHDVRIGRGLVLGAGLILAEGATISSFAVKCLLPRGTRIGGSLRIGENSTVNNNVSFGAENWIGKHVHIGENVRFGPCVKVEDGISIGANAWIKGHTRLLGNVPENAEVAAHAAGRKIVEPTQAGSAYAIGISPFSITKNETIRERPAVVRRPLALEFNIDTACQNDRTHSAVQEAGTPDRPSGKTLPDKLYSPKDQSPAAIRGKGPEPRTPSAVGKTSGALEVASGALPVHPDAPAGVQRKRGGDAMAGRSVKRLCTGLESRYKDAESGSSPFTAAHGPDNGTQEKPFDLSRLLNKSAFLPVQETTTSTGSSTTTAWLDLQRPVRRPSDTASPSTAAFLSPVRQGINTESTERRQSAAGLAAARQHAPESLPDRDAQRKAWETALISKENQNALERGMRQSIRVPTANPRVKPDEHVPEPMARQFSPMYASKGPNL